MESPKTFQNQNSGTFQPIIHVGFSSAAALWVTWFVTHVPWIGVSAPVATGLVVAVWFASILAFSRGVTKQSAIPACAGAGLFSALIGLRVLGSKLVQTGNTLIPNAALIAGGFLATGVVVGSVAGIARRSMGASAPDSWLPRFAWSVVSAAAPLLFIGGLVTSTNSGMAVPDWPTSYGANMFLYPLGNAPTSVFLEHSHRLFGTLLGLGSILLMIWVLISEPRVWVKVWATCIFVAVCLQGLLGGQRVRTGSTDPAMDSRITALIHGVSAQIIFAALVALAIFLSRLFVAAQPATNDPKARSLRAISGAALHTTLLQLIFGAIYRHSRSSHALWTHAGFSLFVVVISAFAGFRAAACAGDTPIDRSFRVWGKWLVALVGLQFILGWAAFGLGTERVLTDSVLQAVVRTAHQANGALLLAVTTIVAILARRRSP